MNLIPCSSECRYQFDGRCELAGSTSILSDNKDRCPFYKKRDEYLFPGSNFGNLSAEQLQHPQCH